MDHLVVALLNTGSQAADPLETPLGAARWWAGVQSSVPPVATADGKPRFDGALAASLRSLRAALEAAMTGPEPQPLPLAFRGDASDAMLFAVSHAACTALADGTMKRIRRCSGRACGRYFLDETKNGSRRWCSLRCMERARAPRRRTIAR